MVQSVEDFCHFMKTAEMQKGATTIASRMYRETGAKKAEALALIAALIFSMALPLFPQNAHAATSSVSMIERYEGGNSVTTTDIANYAFTWRAPSGISSLSVEARGGGGGGGGSSATTTGAGGGGGGGGYAYSTSVSANGGTNYALSIGRSGSGGSGTSAGTAGTASSFGGTTVVAAAGGGGGVGTSGGTGGTGGASNTGGTTYNGGTGSNGVVGSASGSGGGGAGSTENGGAASGTTAGAGGSLGGGTGAEGRATDGVGNSATNVYGAGGAGGYKGAAANRAGGAGTGGLLTLSYDYEADDDYPIIRGISGGRSDVADTGTHPVTLPPGIEAGELLVVVFTADQVPTVSVNTGVSGNNWTKLGQASNGSTVTGAVFWKIAEGGDVLTLTTSNNQQGSYIAYRITNHAGIVTGTAADGNSTNSDPPDHVSGTDANEHLWIATRSGDSTAAATAVPNGYDFWRQADASGSSGAATDAAVRFALASSEDPGTWTSSSEQWVSWTLAVPSPLKPSAPVLYSDSGGSAQIAFDNAGQNDSSPTFRASALYQEGENQTFNRFQIQMATTTDFSSTIYAQTFSGSYASGTVYALTADSLSPSLPTSIGTTTYYVRVRASADGSKYGLWSTSNQPIWSYTYTQSEEVIWLQTTGEQFSSDTISSALPTTTDGVTMKAGDSLIYLTAGTSWAVPDDWNAADNMIEVIGGGGGGGANRGGGGGGGGYSAVSNIALPGGTTVGISVGAGGGTTIAGGDTYLCNSASDCASIGGSAVVVGAKGGTGGTEGSFSSGGVGGSADSGIGTTKYSGGSGAGNIGGNNGGGGGGAAGPNGNGGGGSSGLSSGGAGGGNGGGSSASGAVGGNNYLGVGGGSTSGAAGTAGGGGAGGGNSGGAGGAGQEWDSTHGSGGGGGGTGNGFGTGGNGGLYGGGGGGGLIFGSSGAQGIIVVSYGAAATGFATSSAIRFDSVQATSGWGEVTVTGTVTHGSVSVQVADANQSPIEGYSCSISVSSCSIDLSGLDPFGNEDHATLYLIAALTRGEAGVPILDSWTVSWAPPAPPTIATNAVSNIGVSTASLNGNITNTGGHAGEGTQHGFAYGTSTDLGGPNVATTTLGSYSGTGGFSGGIEGLAQGTTYYVRAYGANQAGTSTGSIVSFTTKSLPSVTTDAASDIGAVSATINGNITALGGENATARGFAWGTSATLTGGGVATTTSAGSFGTGGFTHDLSELAAETTYYFRAYAVNSVGTSTGAIVSFTTVPDTLAVITDAASNITHELATLGGTIDAARSGIQHGFAWGTDPALADENTATTTLGTYDGSGSFDQQIAELDQNSFYYFRAYATKSDGTAYGGIVTFKTRRYSGGGQLVGTSISGAGVVSGGERGGGESIGSEIDFFAPGTNAAASGGGLTSADAAYASDDSYATAAASAASDYYSFGFNVPETDAISGIAVKLEASGSSAAGTISIELSWDGGSSVTSSNKTTATLSTSDTVYTLGGSSDTWGRGWSASEIQNANFRVRITGNPSGNTVRLDALQVRIYHQASGGGGGGGGEI
jgi:hypothetical protein